jgi:hypothetical protein
MPARTSVRCRTKAIRVATNRVLMRTAVKEKPKSLMKAAAT